MWLINHPLTNDFAIYLGATNQISDSGFEVLVFINEMAINLAIMI